MDLSGIVMNRTIICADELEMLCQKPSFQAVQYTPPVTETICTYCSHVQIHDSVNCQNCYAEGLARLVGLDADENKVYYLDA